MLWPILGIIFAPSTTMMWVLCAPGGINGLDWLWIGLGIVADVAFWGSGAYRNRDRMPGSASTVCARDHLPDRAGLESR